jgi:hypothetical protein
MASFPPSDFTEINPDYLLYIFSQMKNKQYGKNVTYSSHFTGLPSKEYHPGRWPG